MIDRARDRRGSTALPSRLIIGCWFLALIGGWEPLGTPARAQVPKTGAIRKVEAPAAKPAGEPALPAGIRLKQRITWPDTRRVVGLSFSPDGRTVAASGGNRVNFWSTDGGRSQARLASEEDGTGSRDFYSVAYSPDGQSLAAGSGDGTITVWDLANGRKPLIITGHQEGDPTGSAHRVHRIAYSPDGKLLASASWDKTARLWDAATGRQRLVLKHPGKVRTLAFSPDGKLLATGMELGPEETVLLWESDSGKPLGQIAGNRTATVCLAFTADGRVLATGGRDHQVRLWDVASRLELAELTGHTEAVSCLAFSPDGRWLISAGGHYQVPNAGEFQLWDVTTGQHRLTLPRSGERYVSHVAFAPDGGSFATIDRGDGSVSVWAFSPESLAEKPGHQDLLPRAAVKVHEGRGATSIAVAPDGKTLAAASERVVKLYDLPSRAERARLQGHEGSVMQVVFSPDGKLLASSAADGEVRLWDVAAARELNRLQRPDVTTYPIAFTPDGESVVVSWRYTSTKAWDVSTGSLSDLFQTNWTGPLVYSPDGRLLAVASDGERNGTVRLLGTAVLVGQARNMLHDGGEGKGPVVRAVPPVLPTATASQGTSSVELLNAAQVSAVPAPAAVPEPVPARSAFAVALDQFAEARERLGALRISANSVDMVFEQAPPRAPADRNPQTGIREITCLAYAPDGQTLAAGEWNHGGSTHDVVLWTIANGQLKARLGGQTSAIRAVAFSPDGRWIAAVSGDRTGPEHDGEAKIWDAHTQKERVRLVGHRGPILTLAFTPDGRTIITGGADGIVRFWDWPAR